MLRAARWFLFVWVLCASAVNAQVHEKYRYLIDATNKMNALLAESVMPDRQVLLKVTSQACGALSTLLEDNEFRSDLKRLASNHEQSFAYRQELKRELDLFVLHFLRIEEKALLDAGLDERVTRDMLRAAATYRNQIDIEFDPSWVQHNISLLRMEVCDGARSLDDIEKNFQRVKKWAFGIGAVAIIAIDAGIMSVAMPAAVVSGVVGELMLHEVIKGAMQ